MTDEENEFSALPLDNEPAPVPAVHPISDLDWSDVADDALQLLREYVPIKEALDPKAAKAWAEEQLRLLAIADLQGDTDFLRNYPRALAVLADSQGVVVARGREELIRDRFIIIARLALRILSPR